MMSTLNKNLRKHGAWMGLITVLVITAMVAMAGCSSSPTKPATPDVVIQQDLGDINLLSDTTKIDDGEVNPR